jgi:hypothetical protein
VPIMAEQLEGTDIPRLVVGFEISKFWRRLQHVFVHAGLAIENLDRNASTAQRGGQVQQANGQRAQRGLVEVFHRRLDEEDFHGDRFQRL